LLTLVKIHDNYQQIFYFEIEECHFSNFGEKELIISVRKNCACAKTFSDEIVEVITQSPKLLFVMYFLLSYMSVVSLFLFF
jgi:hypothetical protein